MPIPRLRAGPESLPGLRSGYSDTPRQVPTTNKETPRSPASPLTVPEMRLHQPAASRSGEDWARRGPPNLSPEVGDPPPQRCSRTGIGPFPPLPPPAASASQPELHPARCTPTLQLGRSAGPSSPAPLRAPLPPQPRLKQTPCFCFEFSTPPRGRGT